MAVVRCPASPLSAPELEGNSLAERPATHRFSSLTNRNVFCRKDRIEIQQWDLEETILFSNILVLQNMKPFRLFRSGIVQGILSKLDFVQNVKGDSEERQDSMMGANTEVPQHAIAACLYGSPVATVRCALCCAPPGGRPRCCWWGPCWRPGQRTVSSALQARGSAGAAGLRPVPPCAQPGGVVVAGPQASLTSCASPTPSSRRG